jgi:hypothetical protein
MRYVFTWFISASFLLFLGCSKDVWVSKKLFLDTGSSETVSTVKISIEKGEDGTCSEADCTDHASGDCVECTGIRGNCPEACIREAGFDPSEAISDPDVYFFCRE